MYRKASLRTLFSILACTTTLLLAGLLSGCGGNSAAITITIGGTGGLTVVDGNDTLTLTATLANDSSGKGVTWALSGTGCTGSSCGTLTNETATTAVYTAPATPTTALTVTVTATSAADSTKTGTFTITVPAALAVSTTNSQLAGSVGTAFSQQLATTTGEGTLTWSVDSSTPLPANWALSSGGLLTGTPHAADVPSLTFKVNVSDSGSPTKMTATATLTVAITAAPTITFGTAPAATATVGTGYSSAVTATGGAGALSYTLSAGALPAGSNWGISSAGLITGTPTVAEVSATAYSFTVKAADGYGDSATHAYAITVSYPQLTVGNPGSLTAYNGTAYTTGAPLATLSATGGTNTYTGWSLTAQGGSSVPAGLSINSSGKIIGTPTGSNTSYSVTATVTDSASEQASANFTITLKAGVSINSATLPTGYAGSVYTNTTLTATGGTGTPYTWTWAAHSGSSIPSGLSISSSGTIGGTVGASVTPNTYSVDVTAKDSANNTTTSTFTITINAGVTAIAPGTIPTFYPGNASYGTPTFTASGGSGTGYSYTWAATGGTAAPSGLSLTQTGANAGLIAGTPTNATSSSVVSQMIVTAKDSVGNTGTTTVSITILAPISITPTTLPTGVVGSAYSEPLQASGGAGGPWVWTLVSGSANLTAVGLNFNTATGTVAGTTPIAGGPESFTVTAQDTNGNTSAQATLSVTVNATLGITTGALSPTFAYGGSSYTGPITTSGGTGPYTWSIASSSATTAAQLLSYGLSLGSGTTSTNSIGATTVTASAVTTTTPLSITVQVTDSSTPTHATATATYSLTLYPQLMLTPNLPSVAEGATLTAGQETVTASGGSAVGGGGGYNFTVSGLPGGLSSSVSGNVVSIIGTAPASSRTNNFTVTVKDTTTNVSVGTANDESITVNAPGATVGGNITITNACGGTSPNPTMTVKLMQSSTVVQTTTTTNGSYSFTGIAAGNYTIVPSYTGTGIQSEFYPQSLSITASGNTLTNENFSAAIGYTVTGTNLNYSGGVVGQIYLNLTSNSCGNNGAVAGTSVHTTGTISGGTFTIQGVPPGTFTLKTFEDPDTLGQGQPNATDPVASDQSVTVTTAPTSVSNPVNLSNPTYTTPSANPQFQVTQIPNGVLLYYQASTNGSKIEDANEYVVNWSESSTLGGGTDGNQFLNVVGTHTFKAIGPNSSTVWILNNAILPSGSQFQVGHSYYFQVRSYNTLATQTHVSGAWWTNSTTTPTPIVSTATPCASGCTAVTSSITIPSGVTINTGAPLYEGFFQQTSNGAPTIYATVDLTPTTGSALSYTVSVPSGAGWTPFAILDQNLDGLIDAGNPNDTNNNSNGYTISGATQTVAGGTLASTGATASVSTNYYSSVYNGGSSTGYNLNIDVEEANQLPVAVELESSPNIMYPIDLSDYCPDCGHLQWQTGTQLQGVTPSVGDTYTFKVWYLGVSSPSTITGKVVGWNGGSTLTGPGALPYNLSPAVTATTSPAFSWSLPAADSTDSFQFWLNDNSVGQIWAIPSSSSNANGFASSITSLAWDVDPTDSSNKSTETTLNSSDTYSWSIEATDSYNNQAQATTWFIP